MTASEGTVGPGEVYYDPYDFQIDDDPYPAWKRMRDEMPLYRNDRFGRWVNHHVEPDARRAAVTAPRPGLRDVRSGIAAGRAAAASTGDAPCLGTSGSSGAESERLDGARPTCRARRAPRPPPQCSLWSW